MADDLDPIFQNWPYEPGEIQARIIQGLDGLPKVQLRLDIGVLQMELNGRPDGRRPYHRESLLHYYEGLAKRRKREGNTEKFELQLEDCIKLQQEGIQYYHRYLALFHLKNFEGVVRDTERNLHLFDFVSQYAASPELAGMFVPFRPYVIMMLTRARGMLALEKKDIALALKHIEWGIEEIRGFLFQHYPPEAIDQNAELNFLYHWMQEVKDRRPLSALEKLERKLHRAVEAENYELAAKLRDEIRRLGPTTPLFRTSAPNPNS